MPAVKLTEAAAEEIKKSKEDDSYLRVSVNGGGCSGTVLDYYSDISKRGFTFTNPNAVKSCGCGSSFQA